MSRTIKLWAVVGILLVAGGCGETRRPAPSVTFDPPPPRQDVEVKEGLKEGARLQLTTAIADRDALVRMHAVEAIKEALGSGGRNQILTAFADFQPTVRFAAAMAAGELRLEEALPTLHRLLNSDKDAHVQIAVIFALHRMGDTRFSQGLETALQSSDPEVRSDAAVALGRLGEKSAVRILQPMLRDPKAETRLQAAEALWRLGDEEGLRYLVAASISRQPAHKMVAIVGLAGPRDRRVIEHVRAGLDTDYMEVALVAARALGMLGSDEAYSLASNGTKSVEPHQRYLAALALGAIGRTDAQDLLAPLLNDAETDVRLAAATAILSLR